MAVVAVGLSAATAVGASAATIKNSGGTLTYDGTAAKSDIIFDQTGAGAVRVVRDGTTDNDPITSSDCAETTPNEVYTCNGVTRVVANGGDGDDALNAEQLESIPATLNGGGGADSVNGGDVADTVNGDAGRDSVGGGEGDDTLNGGADKDLVLGGLGNDTVGGGDGDDILVGLEGDDRLLGEGGNARIPSSSAHRRIPMSSSRSTMSRTTV